MFRITLPPASNREIPHFFSPSKRTFVADVSWRVGRNRKPDSFPGARRYPIGYHPSSALALTGLGVNFCAPYVSDAERHGPSPADELNAYIDTKCTDALIEAMAVYLVPRHSGHALALYITDTSNSNEDRLADLLQRTLDRRALPLRRTPPTRRSRSRSDSSEDRRRRRPRSTTLGPRRTSTGTLRRIAVPLFTWDPCHLSPLLSRLCPPSEDQIASDVPTPFLQLLASNSYDDVITFDENDVLMRLQPLSSIPHFPWNTDAEWRRALGNPAVARRHLDVVYQMRRRGSLHKEDTLTKNVHLPDRDSVARPLRGMYRAVDLPPALGGHETTALVHPDILAHPLLKAKAWMPARFTLDDYLDNSALSSASAADRKLFWHWLRTTMKLVPTSTLNRISELPVWPDSQGGLARLGELCQPRHARAVQLLARVLRQPSTQLRKLVRGIKNRRTRIAIRSQPNHAELDRFLADRISALPRTRSLTPDECRDFHKFERDLGFLIRKSTSALRADLSTLSARHGIALSRDQRLTAPNELVRMGPAVSRLHLPPRFLVDRSEDILEEVPGWGTRQTATVEQLLAAFDDDASRLDAHVPRLQAYVTQARQEGITPTRIAQVPCIPVNGRPLPPAALALRGSQNYWGEWKTRLSVTGLNPEVQRLYREVGVTGGEPTASSTRDFFFWLAQQDSRIIHGHVDQVLRHIGYRRASTTWLLEDPVLPFIPVEVDNQRVRLVTKAEATRLRGKVAVPDFDALAADIRRDEPPRAVDLAIVTSDNVTQPIATVLRGLGLRTLTEIAGAPVRTCGETNVVLEGDLLRTLDSIRRGKRGRQLQKRLEALDLDVRQSRLRHNWRERLGRIRSVSSASSVNATYRLGRRSHCVAVQHVFDERTDTLWLDSTGDKREFFFAAVAERIFESPKRYLGVVLEKAHALDIREQSFLSDLGPEDAPDEQQDRDRPVSSSIAEPVATEARHPQPDTDPARNIPTPGPIPTASNRGIDGKGRARGIDGKGRARPTTTRGPKTVTRRQAPEENAQIENIKEKQYAWHCQRCLGMAVPEVLAPSASYVARYENRRHVMYAHHCDHASARGARHAGNLLLLCQYHHWELGDAFSRLEIVRALVKGRTHELVFGSEDERDSSVEGRLVEVRLPQREKAVSLFFTEAHAEYWVAKAREEGLI